MVKLRGDTNSEFKEAFKNVLTNMHLSKQKCYDITRYNSNLFTTNDSRKETMKRSKLKSSFDRYRVWRA